MSIVDYAEVHRRNIAGETQAEIAADLNINAVALRKGLSRWKSSYRTVTYPIGQRNHGWPGETPTTKLEAFTPPLEGKSNQKVQHDFEKIIIELATLTTRVASLEKYAPRRLHSRGPRKTPRRDQIVEFINQTAGIVTYQTIAEGLGVEPHIVKNTVHTTPKIFEKVQPGGKGTRVYVQLR